MPFRSLVMTHWSWFKSKFPPPEQTLSRSKRNVLTTTQKAGLMANNDNEDEKSTTVLKSAI